MGSGGIRGGVPSHLQKEEVLMDVNRKDLLAKLAKMGLSPSNMYRMNHGIVAVEEFVASESRDYTVTAEDASFESPDVEETIWHKCPKCTHEWKTEETFYASETEVDGADIAGMVEVSVASNGPKLSPGSLVLTAEEVAFMVLEFAMGTDV